jgi:glycosyltransferase involved in cell wall biosynthesis
MIWQIVTGEYPPDEGGVGDYTRVVAHGLAAAGDEVHVWTPETIKNSEENNAVQIHRLTDHFGPRAILQLDRVVARSSADCVLIQYVPQAFGCRGLNLPFCGWLYGRRPKRLMMMFHEVTFPSERGDSRKRRLLGTVSRLMASLASQAASQVFVSTPIWTQVLRSQCGFEGEARWLPLPSVIPVRCDKAAVRTIRSRCNAAKSVLIGHFSSYPESSRAQLGSILSDILARRAEAAVLLLGRHSRDFRTSLAARQPNLAARIFAAGALSKDELSDHLSACDVMLQLYPDGACARRTTLVTALAHGRPIVTNAGPATEPMWKQTTAVALAQNENQAIGGWLERLIDEPKLRKSYSEAAVSLYQERFELRHGIKLLRAAGCE